MEKGNLEWSSECDLVKGRATLEFEVELSRAQLRPVFK
jgi:hypothetical protein